jgi:hypothetical protein
MSRPFWSWSSIEHHVRKIPPLFYLIAVLVVTSATVLPFVASDQFSSIAPASVTREQGLAWSFRPPADSAMGLLTLSPGDGSDAPDRSRLVLFEDGHPLSEAHAKHDDIRNLGDSRYSHWYKSILFSSSDGTPPTNGTHTYTYHAERRLSTWFQSIALLCAFLIYLRIAVSSLASRILGEMRTFFRRLDSGEIVEQVDIFRIFFFGYAVLLLLFAYYIHPIEDHYGANPELDFYVKRAALFGAGSFPDDPFRPALYTLLGGIAGHFFDGRYFIGCQAISIISGLLFIYCCYRIAVLLFDRNTALLLLIPLSLNVNVIAASVRAASDMLFQALIMLALLRIVHSAMAHRARLHDFLFLGVLFGLAFTTRYTAVFLMPVLVLYSLVIRRQIAASHLLAFCLATLITITPQLILNYYHFGAPFYNENWRNLALHYFGSRGSEVFFQYTKDYLTSEFINNPNYFLETARDYIYTFFDTQLPQILFGPADQDSVIALQRLMTFMMLLVIPVVLMKKMTTRGIAGHLLYTSYPVFMIVGIGASYSFEPRFVLPIIPFVFAYFFGGIHLLVDKRTANVCLGAVILFTLYGQLPAIGRFAGGHVRDDLYAAQWLRDHEGNRHVMGTSLFLGNHFSFPYTYLDATTAINNDQRYAERVYDTIRNDSPEYFIVNPVSAYGKTTPACLLNAPNETFPFLIPLTQIGSSIIYKIDYRKLPPPD